MRRWSNRHLFFLIPLLLVPLVCGVYTLAHNAPRDWALHWAEPQTALARTAQSGNFDAVSTPAGYDLLWTTANNGMRISRFAASGHRLGPDQAIRGTEAELTLNRMGASDVAIWRQDTANGAMLRAAVIRPGAPVRYITLVSGTAALEHPRAFPLNGGVGVVFSWQTNKYDVYLSGVSRTGRALHPTQLTHVSSYGFLPHAVQEPSGRIRLLYFDACCTGSAFNVLSAQYSSTGREMGLATQLDQVQQGSQGQSGTPNAWGSALQSDGRTTWAVWSSNAGIETARWTDGRSEGRPITSVPGPQPQVLTVVLSGNRREIGWQQPYQLGQQLQTIELGADALPVALNDRVAFEGASDEVPLGIAVAGTPTFFWDSTRANSTISAIESSRFSVATLGAPNTWARIGLGLSNPLGNFFLLVVGALAVGALIAMGNILLILGLVGVYVAAFRQFRGLEKWWAYTGVLAAALWLILVALGAPFPPVVVLSQLSSVAAWIALGGMVVFVLILTTTLLGRFEDLYRAATMAFMSIYFLAFLQALVIVQGQIATI